tara:strand:- start:3433 stop:4449 length:1017 start_codon:yes stop_codon:yes gene_type:complete
MQEKINKIINDIQKETIATDKDLQNFQNTYLSKKGIIYDVFNEFKQLPNTEKKELGRLLNELKKTAHEKAQTKQVQKQKANNKESGDLTRPGSYDSIGAIHPISQVQNKIVKIFQKVGFIMSEGPEIEDDWHNFSALNMPKNHPARDMQDTFFISLDPDTLLRTHTSSVQIRYMEKNQPPIRIISPGRVYRKEDISARAHCIFHQIEGLYINQNVSFADLKKMIMYFVESLFGKDVKIRFRPSFFPFTEPSAEVDIYWGLKTESDYRITKGTGWLEIMGCGMIDPNVLENVNIDPIKFSGFAFGLGIERITMLLHQIEDLRLFFENDLRFLKQFQSIK